MINVKYQTHNKSDMDPIYIIKINKNLL